MTHLQTQCRCGHPALRPCGQSGGPGAGVSTSSQRRARRTTCRGRRPGVSRVRRRLSWHGWVYVGTHSSGTAAHGLEGVLDLEQLGVSVSSLLRQLPRRLTCPSGEKTVRAGVSCIQWYLSWRASSVAPRKEWRASSSALPSLSLLRFGAMVETLTTVVGARHCLFGERGSEGEGRELS